MTRLHMMLLGSVLSIPLTAGLCLAQDIRGEGGFIQVYEPWSERLFAYVHDGQDLWGASAFFSATEFPKQAKLNVDDPSTVYDAMVEVECGGMVVRSSVHGAAGEGRTVASVCGDDLGEPSRWVGWLVAHPPVGPD
jgi:hypothetical protein